MPNMSRYGGTTKNMRKIQDIPIIKKLCRPCLGIGLIPSNICTFIDLQLINPPHTINYCESLRNNQSQADDYSYADKKSSGSIKLTSCLSVKPPGWDKLNNCWIFKLNTYWPANDEEAAKGNCKTDSPRLKNRKLQRRTPDQWSIITRLVIHYLDD